MARKRPNNDGSIRQRKDGTWEARYVAGTKPDGKPNRKSVYGPTQEDVKKKLREALQQLERGTYVEPSKITVGEWLSTWYKVYGLPRWRPNTAAVHDDSIRLALVPALGKIFLQKLRPDQVQSFINNETKKGLAPATVRKRFFPLQAALKQALANQMITTNPAATVSLPQTKQKEIQFLTIEEQRTLMPFLPDNTLGRAIKFILCTGLRVSELCGLRWEDIGEDSFTIKQSAQYVRDIDTDERAHLKQKLYVMPPKSKAGWRVIPLTESIKVLLDTQKREQVKARWAASDAWAGGTPGKGTCFAFASEMGTALDRNNISRLLRSCLHKAGLKNRGVHALRHTFATNCIRTGMDVRTLSEILGHSDVALTLRLYVHSDIGTKRKGMQAVENLF